MSSMQQVQAVAKRLEKMLETALNQLKLEQKLRKEADNKLINLELSLVNSEHDLKTAEENYRIALTQKEERIFSLESQVKKLEANLLQKEQELLDSRDGLDEDGESPLISLEETAGRFEDRLKGLLDITDETDIDDDETEPIGVDSADEVEEDIDEESEEKPTSDKMAESVESKTFVELYPEDIGRCNVCSDEFPSRKELAEHEKETGHGYSLTCGVCEKKFKTKYTLKSHEDVVHNDKMPFKCRKCDQRFKDLGSCKRHQANDDLHKRLEKEKASPFLLCNICGKEFPRKRRWCLDQHYLTHLDTKKYLCTTCGKEFIREGYLAKHKVKCALKRETVT